MFDLLMRIYCFLFSHKRLGGSPALTLMWPEPNVDVALEVCPRCKQLWANPNYLRLPSTGSFADALQGINKKMEIYDTPSSVKPEIECDFLLDENSDDILTITVFEKTELQANVFEVVTTSGKTIAWSLDKFVPKTIYTAKEEEDIHLQIGNLLNKVEGPIQIYASVSIFNALDFGIAKSPLKAFHKSYGITGTAPSNPQGFVAQGTLSKESEGSAKLSGSTSYGELWGYG